MIFRNVLVRLFLAIASFTIVSCVQASSEWSEDSNWYKSENGFDSDKIDVFYLVSTEVISATDSKGKTVPRTLLTEEDLGAIQGEIAWVEKNMFYDDFNLIAPYYHQMSFNALTQMQGSDFSDVYNKVAKEVCEAFDFYMENQNGGRPFIIAGFSQGAMLSLDLLSHMSDEQYSRMIACYTLGYRLSAEDLEDQHIKAATSEGDTGVVISFNSTQTREAIWPLVSADAATCINPINWKTDDTPASFEFNETANTVHIDPQTNVLLVDTDDPDYYRSFYDLAPFFISAGVKQDNLHHWDLLFYARQIHDNALLRAENAIRRYF